MPVKDIQNIFLTPELQRLIDEEIDAGHHRTASEVVRAGLRLLFESRGKLGSASRAAAAYRTSQQVEALFAQTTAAMSQCDLSGRFLRVNDHYCAVAGRGREDLLGLRMQDITHPEDLPRNRILFERAVEKGEAFEIEKRYLRPDGSVVWVRNAVSLIRDAAGAPESLLAVSIDISAHKRIEEALRESEERFRLLADVAPGLVWISNPDTGIQYANNRLFDYTGLSRAEALPNGWLKAVHPDDMPRRRQAWAEAHAGGRFYEAEFRLRRRDGVFRWHLARGEPWRDPVTGQIKAWFGTTVDIHDHKMAEEALRESEALKGAILDAALDCIVTIDAGSRVIEWNPAAEQTFGYSREEVLGHDLTDLIIPPEHREAHRRGMVRYLATGQAPVLGRRIELEALRVDGSRFPVELAISPIQIGNEPHFTAYLRDITTRKRWEEHQQLLINELNHRVKNTLATVQSIASQTLRNADTSDEARSAVEARLFALSRAHDVLTRQNWEGASLREIVTEALAPYAHDREGRLLTAGPDVRLAPRMALALAMALHELATNAAKYGALSNAAGEIRIEWAVRQENGEPRLQFTWVESGGPPVAAPTRRGFGTRLIERSLASDLDGKVRIEFMQTGLVCAVDAPLPSDQIVLW